MEWNTQTILVVILGSIALIKYGADLFVFLTGKDYKQSEDIKLIKNDFSTLSKAVVDIKVNHIGHIEKDINSLNIEVAKIHTILEERLPRKK